MTSGSLEASWLPHRNGDVGASFPSVRMKVVTMVRGEVPSARAWEFEANYQPSDNAPLPPGLERSFLLRDADKPGTYVIETLWSSREALQAMRSREKPRAVALFEEMGASPTVEIHEVVGTVP